MSLAGRLQRFSSLHRFSRRTRLRYTLIGHLLILMAVSSAVLGIDLNRSHAYHIFAISFSVLFVSWLFTLRRAPVLELERCLPVIATAGQPVEYRLRIRNPGTQDVTGLLIMERFPELSPDPAQFTSYRRSESRHDNWFDRRIGYPVWHRLITRLQGGHSPEAELDHLPAGEAAELSLTLEPVRRGYIRLEGVSIGIAEPLGLCRRIRTESLPGRILALPRIYRLPRLQLPGGRHHHQGGVQLAASVADSMEFHGLRDYRPGDPLRNIHWRSWARFDRPVVKTWEEEYFVRHALVVDTCGANNGETQLEQAISAAASLAIACNDQEMLLEMMLVADRAHSLTSGRHLDSLQHMLELLACLNGEAEAMFTTLSRNVLERSDQLASVLCILLQWDTPRQELIRTLQKRGIDTLVIVVEPADAGPGPEQQVRRGQDGEYHVNAASMEHDLNRLVATLSGGGG